MNDEQSRHDLASLRIDPDRKLHDRPRGKGWWWLVVAVIVIALATGFFALRKSLIPATSVQTAVVSRISASQSSAELIATGYVVSQRKAEVASKGTGRLEYLGFEEGDKVRKGEIIARLDNEDIKANLALARANLKQAAVDTLDAGRNYRRQQNLFQSGAITDVTLEAAETRYNNSLAALDAARASVRAKEVDLENTFIRAPFDGTILSKNADVGEMVAPFASASSSKGSVVTLADMSSLEVEADVSESNIYKVRPGQPCRIILDAYPQTNYTGYVKKIVPTADRARATVLTKVAFDKLDTKVLPEMSARIAFLSATPDRSTAASPSPATLVVPKEALTFRNGISVVFRVKNNQVTEVAVTTGRDLDQTTEITSGLKEGDVVVLAPPGKMQTGQKVTLAP